MKSHSVSPILRRFCFLVAYLLLTGCASYVLNQPLSSYDDNGGYRFPNETEDRSGNTDSLFVCLTFSGGGTRAAAFAYGVLKKLRETSIRWEGQNKNLLAEVDCISGISGGSFTAAYYGLFGNRIFEDYRDRFLDRDVENELFWLAINPLSWPRLLSPKFNRIDLASELYDETIFGNKTFADLKSREKRPFIILNATDLASGERFEFTQEQFDLIGSDLSKLPVARAVAASSAFPFLLSPITLKNYPQVSNYATPSEISNSLQDFDDNRRKWHWAMRKMDYLNKTEHPYIHLMDGGLSDNIGLRAIENVYRRTSGFIRQRLNKDIKKLLIITVNSKSGDHDTISKTGVPPDLAEVGYKTATIALDNYSFETIEAMRDLVKQRQQTQETLAACNAKIKQCPSVTPFPLLSNEVETEFIDISFEAHPNPTTKKELQEIPTSFTLTKNQVDLAVQAGSDLLEYSRQFQKIRTELQSDKAK